MTKSLIIVESPAKAKTIKKYLGNGFDVEASSGHLIDLPSSRLGVDIDDNFKPDYIVIKGKKKYLNQLEKAAKNADKVYMASDPDREGEAIAWHITDRLNLWDKAHRILFHEITENAVKDSIDHPTKLSKDRFEAQQARRILDRIVGYKVSPILWKKVRRGLSAGRVQSVALRIVVQREREIEAFNPVEYWTLDSLLKRKTDDESKSFTASIHHFDGEKVKIENENQVNSIIKSISNKEYVVKSVQRKERKRKSLPPFITSTLQQEASRKLRFSVRKTMTIAQRLYEGIELGEEGPVGLITYMRTDSVRISDHAISEVREFIKEKYGNEYMPEKPNVFKVKKSAQDAHEGIRPTFSYKKPNEIKEFLSDDQFKLYELIWKRFVSSQMTPAIYDQTSVDIEVGQAIFRATGSIIKFPGFTTLYIETKEEDESDKDKDELKQLPELNPKDILDLLKLDPKQHFTQPPPRFTESSLVKELEEKGIGRPSTYAAILSTIQERGYINKEKNRLRPTLLGSSVNDLLIEGFPEIMDVQFTADMEDKLDKVEEGDVNWIELLSGFYDGFSKRLDNAE
ncbi:MAG: type I DNA topoisomerase, partial [Candidatus Dadabacteria bacterium]|nr:type I DNA topoisomerase [Candidatus Dadabacteria bacterium]NIQ13282.1 type I DNA topoisomerase [Candidatus Dadabacteria bacterium]